MGVRYCVPGTPELAPIIEPHRTRRVYNWLQYFSPATLAAEFEQSGLRVVEQYADVAGAPYADGEVLAVVAQKIS